MLYVVCRVRRIGNEDRTNSDQITPLFAHENKEMARAFMLGLAEAQFRSWPDGDNLVCSDRDGARFSVVLLSADAEWYDYLVKGQPEPIEYDEDEGDPYGE